mgnify:CR=1 FL=1
MLTEDWTISARNPGADIDHVIYGLTKTGDTPSDKAILMAHGLGCTQHMAAFPEATSKFLQKGYDVIHFEMNGMDSLSRPPASVNLETFADDVTTVASYFRPKYKKLYAVGHSYGGTALILANPEIEAASLWDAAYGLPEDQDWVRDFVAWVDDDHFTPSWNEDITLHRQLLDVEATYTRAKCAELSRVCCFPVQSLLAENFTEETNGESFDTHSPHPASCRKRYNEQDHFFEDDPEAREDMIAQTIAFFEKH